MKLSEYYPSMQGATPVGPVVPAAAPPVIPNDQTQVTRYLRTTLPLPLQYSPDTLKQYNRPGLSSFRIAPLPPGGNPAVNASSTSTSTSNIQQFVNTAANGPNGAIQFNVGGALTGVAQFEWDNIGSNLLITGGASISGTVAGSIFNASTGYRIAGAAGSGQFLRGDGVNFVSSLIQGSDLPTFSQDVTNVGSVMTVVGLQTNPVSSLDPDPGDVLLWTGTAWVPTANPFPGVVTVLYLTDVASDIVPYQNWTTSPNTTAEHAYTASLGSGAVGATDIQDFATVVGYPGTTLVPEGNWSLETYLSATGSPSPQLTVTATVYKRTSGGVETSLFSVTIVSSAIIPSTATQYVTQTVQPAFVIANTDRLVVKYSVSKASGGATVVSLYTCGNLHNSHVHTTFTVGTALVPISLGGTGSDLSLTGGTSQVLRQSSVGANITVSQLSYSDISGTIPSTGIVSGSVNLATQTANHAAATLFATGVSGAGTYLVTVYIVASQAATTSSTLPDSRIIFTDNESGATITVPVTSGLTTNTTSTFAQATFIVNAKASTNIQYDIGQVTPYASVGGTPMQFAYHARAVFLG
jgi:hypothetical protein